MKKTKRCVYVAAVSVVWVLSACAVSAPYEGVTALSPKLLAVAVTPQLKEVQKGSGIVTSYPCARQMDVRNAKTDTCTNYIGSVPGEMAVLGKTPDGKHIGAVVDERRRPILYEESIASAVCSNSKLNRGEALDTACEKPIDLKRPAQCEYLKKTDMCDDLGADNAFLVAVVETKINGLMSLLDEVKVEQAAQAALTPKALAEFRAELSAG